MRRIAFLAAVSIAVLTTNSVRADLPVIDVAVLGEDVIEAARLLQQINNQITQIQQGLHMLQNEARNLTSLPSSILSSIDSDIAQVTGLMAQAQGLAFQVGQIDTQFQSLYPNQYTGASDAQIIQDARTRWQTSVEGFQHTMDVQSQIVTGLPNDQSEMGSLVGQSQGAVGILQAVQAGNQMIALNTKETIQLQALLASQARMQATELARHAEDEEAASEQTRRFIGTGAVYTPVPVQAFP